MFKLTSFFDNVVREVGFQQTQFSSTTMPRSLSFVAKEKFLHQANKNPNISSLVVPEKLAGMVDEEKGLVISPKPEQDFYKIHNELFHEHSMHPDMKFGRGEGTIIHPSATVSERSFLGDRVRIGPGVIVEDFSYIDDDIVIESAAIIGASGHFYKKYDDGLFRVEHAGGVWLEKGVQVLAGAVISKAVHTDFTRVGKDTVVSINVHVAHGCQVGQRCTLTGNTQINGFTVLGDDVWVGPSSTIGNLLKIGSGSRIELGSVVIADIPAGSRVSGNFARDHRANLREYTLKVRES